VRRVPAFLRRLNHEIALSGEGADDAEMGPCNPARWFHMNFAKQLDARELTCPLPVLRAKSVLSGMKSGEILRVVATDPSSVRNFHAFAKQTGHQLVSYGKHSQECEFYLKCR